MKPFFGDMGSLPLPSCALVGSSPILHDTAFGAEIDRHALVARCNNAPTEGFVEMEPYDHAVVE